MSVGFLVCRDSRIT